MISYNICLFLIWLVLLSINKFVEGKYCYCCILLFVVAVQSLSHHFVCVELATQASPSSLVSGIASSCQNDTINYRITMMSFEFLCGKCPYHSYLFNWSRKFSNWFKWALYILVNLTPFLSHVCANGCVCFVFCLIYRIFAY